MYQPLPQKELPTRGNTLTRIIAEWLLIRLGGWRIQNELPDVPKFVVVGAPHTSNWDFLLVIGAMFVMGIKFSWMAKKEMFFWPVRRMWLWLGGIPVDRNRNKKGPSLVEQVGQAFHDNDKLLVAIMPEGTRKKVTSWRTGFYRIAMQADVPIVMGIFDYKEKLITLGHTFYPTGDIEADLPKIQAHYKGIEGKYPSRSIIELEDSSK